MRLNNSSISVSDTDRIEAKFEPLKEYGTITIADKLYFNIEIEMNREQAESLYKALEKELYDETSDSMENRLVDEINRLENKLEYYKERVEHDRREGVSMFDHVEIK